MSKTKTVNDFIANLLTEGANRSADKTGVTLDATGPGTKVADPSDSSLSQGGPDGATKSKDQFDNENKLNNVGTKTAAKRKADKSGVKLEEKEEDKKDDAKSDGGSDGGKDDKKKDKKENPFVKKEEAGDKDGKSDGDSDGGSDGDDDAKKMKEHVDALFAGADTLPEEFKAKATVVFEAAVAERVKSSRTQLEESFMEQLTEETEKAKTDLVEKVNDYMDFVVEQWMEENTLAIESALRAELSESLMVGIKELFEAHYIDLPDEKVDSIAELTEQKKNIETQLNEQMQKNIDLNKKLQETEKHNLFTAVAEGLANTEKDKFKTLCESVAFVSLEDYKTKIETIRSSYYNTKTKSSVQDINEATHTDTSGSTGNADVDRVLGFANRMKK